MDIKEFITFNGIEYRLMGTKKYYLSQSKSSEGRKRAKSLHVAIWEFHNNKEVPKGYEIHHKDGNTFNNDISNLECLTIAEHRKLYKLKDPDKQFEHLDNIRSLASEWHKSEEGREWHKEHWKKSIGKIEAKTYTCEFCGKEFESKKDSRFCSHNCDIKWRYHNQYETDTRNCVICGNEFETKRTKRHPEGSSTCSRSCRGKLNWKNRQAELDEFTEKVQIEVMQNVADGMEETIRNILKKGENK